MSSFGLLPAIYPPPAPGAPPPAISQMGGFIWGFAPTAFALPYWVQDPYFDKYGAVGLDKEFYKPSLAETDSITEIINSGIPPGGPSSPYALRIAIPTGSAQDGMATCTRILRYDQLRPEVINKWNSGNAAYMYYNFWAYSAAGMYFYVCQSFLDANFNRIGNSDCAPFSHPAATWIHEAGVNVCSPWTFSTPIKPTYIKLQIEVYDNGPGDLLIQNLQISEPYESSVLPPGLVESVAAGVFAQAGINKYWGGGFITHPTANATLPRIDITVYNFVSNNISVVAGTPLASPTPPAVPGGTAQISETLIPAGVTSLLQSNITDKRVTAALYVDIGNVVHMGRFLTKPDGRITCPNLSAVPAIGEIGELCVSGGKLYVCTAANTWTVVGTQV